MTSETKQIEKQAYEMSMNPKQYWRKDKKDLFQITEYQGTHFYDAKEDWVEFIYNIRRGNPFEAREIGEK